MYRVVNFLSMAVIVALFYCSSKAAESDGQKTPSTGRIATSQGDKSMAIQITSTAFAEGQPIPKKYTGEGADVSPPLSWTGLPERTKELVLICDDPDAPTAEPWVHWLIYKIPATATGLKRAFHAKHALPTHPVLYREKILGQIVKIISDIVGRCLLKATALIAIISDFMP